MTDRLAVRQEVRQERNRSLLTRYGIAVFTAGTATLLNGYGLAVLVAGLATLLRLPLNSVWGARLPFLLFFPAIMVSARFGGFGPGILTTVLCALATDYFWMEPFHSLSLRDPADLIAIFVFLIVGAFVSGLNESWGRATSAVAQSEQERRKLLENERAQAQAAEEQLRLALEAGGLGTWQWKIGTGEVKWSHELEAIHGLAPGSFPATFDAVQREMHPDDRDRVLEAISRAVATGEEYRIEYRIVRPDGRVRWVEGCGKVFHGQEGRPDWMRGVCSDITERKQAEERFRLAVEAAPVAMVMVNQEGRIVLVNGISEQLFGYTHDELVGRFVDELVPLRFRGQHAEYRTAFLANPSRRMGEGRELYALRKDESEVPVEIGLSPIKTAEGIFILAAVADITERRKAAEAEHRAKLEAEQANRAKDEFLATLSHELRTPLGSVLGWTSILKSRSLPPEQAKHALEVIERNARAELHLVESLLDLSRIVAGKLQLEKKPVDLSAVVHAAVDDLRPAAGSKGVALEVTVLHEPIITEGDSQRLQQIVWNLVSNAIKFTPRNGHVGVQLARDQSSVQIQVADNGEGISPELLPDIFNRFKQAESARPQGGLGLGLAIVQEIVHAHGGKVTACSPGKGQGSTFAVTLPAGESEISSEKTHDPTAPPELVKLVGLQVLVVDDDVDARELLIQILESLGAKVFAAGSAREALESVVKNRPDVLLADIAMPGEDGFTLIRKLRLAERESRENQLLAIAVTGYAGSSDREQLIAAGYDWHLAKPVEAGQLARAVARLQRH
ncbi:MAG: PAS domain S-box protein [Acidobacteria bacterium]|nr:PAS domain S-box protein [Acidobacteriota bacterium]